MLDILGTIGGNILSFPGILGLALGMMTRVFFTAAVLGVLIGLFATAVFANFHFGNIGMMELVIAVLVGLAAAVVGCGIRIKGTTV